MGIVNTLGRAATKFEGTHPRDSSSDHRGCDSPLLHSWNQCLNWGSCHHSAGPCAVLRGHQALPGPAEHPGKCPQVCTCHFCASFPMCLPARSPLICLLTLPSDATKQPPPPIHTVIDFNDTLPVQDSVSLSVKWGQWRRQGASLWGQELGIFCEMVRTLTQLLPLGEMGAEESLL